jgi:hypothetical protein
MAALRDVLNDAGQRAVSVISLAGSRGRDGDGRANDMRGGTGRV